MATIIDLEAESVSSPGSTDGSDRESSTDGDLSVLEKIYDASDLKQRLSECLDDVQCAGSFACFDTLLPAVNPGLFVKNVGVVGLPLAERDAKIIFNQCRQSPFGKGSATIVDTTIRKTWELDPHQFELRNPTWQAYLQDVVISVVKELGITTSGVRADLYKMLLYETGGCFKAHKDSEKAPGMFATLVICLPSHHEGGDIRATHGGDTKIFSTAPTSMFNQSHIAWYSDVVHEVQPVTSGYRLCVTYNLINTCPSLLQSAADLQDEKSKLQKILASWKKDKGLPSMQAYLLDHTYTEANLNYDSMKGADRLRACTLRETCAEADFVFYLAQLEYVVTGEPEEEEYGRGGRFGYSSSTRAGFHELEEEYDRDLKLDTVFDLDGTMVARNVEFDEEDIIQEEPFADRDPDDEDYSGYTGNEGVSATHFYRDTCALIMRKDYRMEFLVKKNGGYSPGDFGSWIDRLTKGYKEQSDDPGLVKDLVYLCKHVISGFVPRSNTGAAYGFRPSLQPISNHELVSVITASLVMKDKALIEAAMTVNPEKLNDAAYSDLGASLHKIGLSFLYEEEMNHIVSCIPRLYERYQALVAICQGYCQAGQKDISLSGLSELKAWIKNKVEEALDTVDSVTARDAETLLNINDCYEHELLGPKIIPFAKRHMANMTFLTVFLTNLSHHFKEGKISSDVASKVSQDLLSEWISLLEIDSEKNPSKRQRISYTSFNRSGRSESNVVGAADSSVSGEAIADIVGHCLSLGLLEEVDQVIAKLMNRMQSAAMSAYDSVYLPCLAKLFKIIQPNLDSPEVFRFRWLFWRFVSMYKERYVQEEPVRPTNWTRSARGCGCPDCARLDRFLASPTEKIGNFRFAEKRRKHLIGRLPFNTYHTVTVRSGPTPYPLQITKTEAEWQQNHTAWKQRLTIAHQKLKELGSKTALDRFMRPVMDSVRSENPAAFDSPLKESHSQAGPEVIDLID